MSDGKMLVVYYSRTGTTRKVAEAAAGALGCAIEEIVDLKKRGGPLGFAVAGKDAALKKLTEIGEMENDPGSYDLVIIGTPVWSFTMSCAVRTWLTREKGRLPAVAFFLTTIQSGIERTFAHMEKLCGKAPIATLALRTKEVSADAHLDKVNAFVAELRAQESEPSI